MKNRYAFTACAAIVFALFFSTTIKGQEKAAGSATGKEALREKSIYVPYEKLWEVFEEKGRGVFLPYEEFMELWRLAELRTPAPVVVEPPVAVLVTEVSGEATVSEDVVAFRAEITIEVLKKGWHEVALRLNDVAITRAVIGETPARLVRDENEGYKLLINKTREDPETVSLDIEFARAYAKTPGRNSVSFECPLAPISRWEVSIPEPGVKVDIHPLLAATDVPGNDANQTRVRAFVGATPTVSVAWTPKAEGARGLTALANVKAEHEMWIEEGVTRNKVKLSYGISRAAVSRLTVEVPAGQKVVNVFDPNVREWSVEEAGNVQTITVQLFEPVEDAQSLVVELERFVDTSEVMVPVVKAAGVNRQQGFVVVRLGSGLRGEAKGREGLLQLDAEELPGHLGRSAGPFCYRYAALPFVLNLGVEKVQPRILADSRVEVRLHPEELTLDLLTLYDIQKAGVFRFGVCIPQGFEIQQVQGVAHGDAKAAKVESYHVDEVDKTYLTVNLGRKAQGKTGLGVRLHRSLQEPDLLSPTGKAVTLPVSIPRVKEGSVEHENGRLVIYGPESLRVNPMEPVGLRPVSYAQASAGMPALERPGTERPVQSYVFADEDVSLTLSAERRAPHVTIRQLLVARIESGVVKYEALFFYDVLYSGVKFLRIDIPAEEADQIRITTPTIRQTRIEGDDHDALRDGYVAWRLEGETEFVGSGRIEMRWERKIAELDIGKTVQFDAPRLIPVNADRSWGQVVLAKAEAIDVVPADGQRGLRAIDPRHDLMPGTAVRDAARAFEFHDEWSLAVKATRYEPKEVKATSIERGLVRMVLTRSDITSVQALYRMRSARQRLVIELKGDIAFDTQPLRINGRPVPLEQGEEDRYFVPLVSQDQNKPFLLELRYVLKGTGHKLLSPGFPDEPAVQQVYLSAYLPKDRTYLGAIGPWNDEMVWMLRGFNAWPRGNRNGAQLLSWVTEGLGVDQGSLSNFPTDGRHLLFSSLRPVSGDGSVLRIVAMRDWVLRAIVLVLILGVGMGLLPVSLPRRAIAVGAAVVLLVLLGVFTPTLVRSVVNNAAVGASFIVLVVWALWFALVTLPRSPGWQERRRARTARRQQEQAPPPLPKKDRPDDGGGEGGGQNE